MLIANYNSLSPVLSDWPKERRNGEKSCQDRSVMRDINEIRLSHLKWYKEERYNM